LLNLIILSIVDIVGSDNVFSLYSTDYINTACKILSNFMINYYKGIGLNYSLYNISARQEVNDVINYAVYNTAYKYNDFYYLSFDKLGLNTNLNLSSILGFEYKLDIRKNMYTQTKRDMLYIITLQKKYKLIVYIHHDIMKIAIEVDNIEIKEPPQYVKYSNFIGRLKSNTLYNKISKEERDLIAIGLNSFFYMYEKAYKTTYSDNITLPLDDFYKIINVYRIRCEEKTNLNEKLSKVSNAITNKLTKSLSNTITILKESLLNYIINNGGVNGSKFVSHSFSIYNNAWYDKLDLIKAN